ncbi:interleukin-31 receptor subunit alpha isoform X2 [Fukomys damarensis]|uniref:interleukin-31 receptor subunit alpha isoform X2 n=1 Tax=Fukomys damarensis TaxID=885580 RepID=UPI0014559DD0|nr:interleukin-31 receptor subunit alpha isoform X2 [Fukomys damarensis]
MHLAAPANCIIVVEALNTDGIIKSDATHWSLNDILKTIPPEILSVKPVLGIKKMLQINWELHALSDDLNYILRFKTVNSTHWMEVNFSETEVYNLTGLQASTEYIISLRCKTNKSRIWSDWSQEKMGMTEEEVPHVLDLWRILKPVKEDGRRPVRLLWKKAKGAPVLEKTLGYNIRYFPENTTNVTEMRTTNQTLDLHLGDETYRVSVTSYNSLGNSIASTLKIPDIHEKPFQCIEAMQVCLVQDQLVVEWQCSCTVVDTWMVEWFPDLDSELSAFSWESVSQAKNWTVHQDKLKPFLCYNISVYPVLQDKVGEPYSIQAYSKEKIPCIGPETKVENIGVKTVTISWKEIPKELRNGFISNYTIFYQAEGGKEFSETVNSSTLHYGLESLTRKTSYSVQVMASTRAGGIKGDTINFKTLSIDVFDIVLITCLVGGGLLMLIIFVMISGYHKPSKLIQLCWPDVPNPAESSIATWLGADFKSKVNLKEFDDSMNTEDRTLKSCSAPTDLIDKLVVNFGNFLEEASIEVAGKSQENILGVEKNEYVTSPYRSDCAPVKSLKEPLALTEIPSRKSQHLYSGMAEETCSEAKEELSSPGHSLGTDHICGDRAQNPYLKNSVTTREFLLFEKLPDPTKREV